jgi:hypothetical protein
MLVGEVSIFMVCLTILAPEIIQCQMRDWLWRMWAIRKVWDGHYDWYEAVLSRKVCDGKEVHWYLLYPLLCENCVPDYNVFWIFVLLRLSQYNIGCFEKGVRGLLVEPFRRNFLLTFEVVPACNTM